jgi:endonuclease/exonuclease/phosphatase (EEP) superfamily protein YafD
MAGEQVRAAARPTPENTLRLFTANVLMENRDSGALLDLIRAQDPDVILLTEPDDWWIEQCRPLETTHRFTELHPQDNTYGMALYSRLELVSPELLFRIEPAIPSIRTGVRLRGGQIVDFHAVHPQPPGIDPPGPQDRQDSGPRDAELLVIARELKARGGPAIVAGDFNDVAWSHTSRLMQRIGGLLDPRVGRGLYNTFDATLPLLRYPLDHVFHTEHFTLAELRRMPFIGSDHFPMFAILCYEPQASQPQGGPTPRGDDRREADEAIEKAR